MDTKNMLPTSLVVAIGFVAVYGVLMLLDPILSGAPAYWIGHGLGAFTLFAIIAWLLFNVKKHGWGISVFLICAQIFRMLADYKEMSQSVTDPAELGTLFIGIAIYIALLIGALVALLMPESRKPFK